MRDDQGPAMHRRQAQPGPECATATQPPASAQGQVVADALEHLADQIRQAAGELRCPDPEAVSGESRQHAWRGPRSVIDLVMYELSKRGIKSEFEPETDLADADRSAARLLAALGVAIPDVP